MRNLLFTITTIFTLPIALLHTPLANSAINVKDASYEKTFVDLNIIERSYNSKSLYQGFFGFGWCSNLESKLEIQEKTVTLQDCNEKNLTEYLLIKNTAQQKIWSSAQRPNEQIVQKEQEYFRVLNGQISAVYNQKGSLTEVRTPTQNIKLVYMKLTDKNDQLQLLIGSDLQAYQILWDDSHHITSLQKNNMIYARYEYEDENLIFTKSEKAVYHLKYDELNNLIQLWNDNGTMEQIKYEAAFDRAIELIQRQHNQECKETFEYTHFSQTKKTKTVKTCNQNLKVLKEYEFINKTNLNGETYLSQMNVTLSHQRMEVLFDAQTGEITKRSLLEL